MASNIKDSTHPPPPIFLRHIYVEELRWPQISHSQVEHVKNFSH